MRPVAAMSLLMLLSAAGRGQSFEVASIKPSPRLVGRDANNRLTIGPAGLSGRNVTLKRLIVQAYALQPHQIFGGPNWLDANEYDIEAKASGPATRERLAPMLRALLAERFQLATHTESRELRVYELVIDKSAKAGPKIHPLPEGGDAILQPRNFRGDLQQFANLLSVQLSIPPLDDPSRPSVASGPPPPVLDKTGLSGVYELHVNIKPEPGADMFALWQRVLQEQLGLRLESRRARVEGLVVDRAEKIPTAN